MGTIGVYAPVKPEQIEAARAARAARRAELEAKLAEMTARRG